LLKRFELLKLIDIQRQHVPGKKERAPSAYTILGTLGNHYPTLGNESTRGLGNQSQKVGYPLPRRRKEIRKEREESNSSSSGKKRYQERPKEPAPFYPQLPPKREVPDQERANILRINKEQVAMLKDKWKMP
jgi:hypothetical protein